MSSNLARACSTCTLKTLMIRIIYYSPSLGTLKVIYLNFICTAIHSIVMHTSSLNSRQYVCSNMTYLPKLRGHIKTSYCGSSTGWLQISCQHAECGSLTSTCISCRPLGVHADNIYNANTQIDTVTNTHSCTIRSQESKAFSFWYGQCDSPESHLLRP